MAKETLEVRFVRRYIHCLPPMFQNAVLNNETFFIREAARLLKKCECRYKVYYRRSLLHETCRSFKCSYRCKCIDDETLSILRQIFNDPGALIFEFLGHRCFYCFTPGGCKCGRDHIVCSLVTSSVFSYITN